LFAPDAAAKTAKLFAHDKYFQLGPMFNSASKDSKTLDHREKTIKDKRSSFIAALVRKTVSDTERQ
jgi:hypothetical protein